MTTMTTAELDFWQDVQINLTKTAGQVSLTHLPTGVRMLGLAREITKVRAEFYKVVTNYLNTHQSKEQARTIAVDKLVEAANDLVNGKVWDKMTDQERALTVALRAVTHAISINTDGVVVIEVK